MNNENALIIETDIETKIKKKHNDYDEMTHMFPQHTIREKVNNFNKYHILIFFSKMERNIAYDILNEYMKENKISDIFFYKGDMLKEEDLMY